MNKLLNTWTKRLLSARKPWAIIPGYYFLSGIINYSPPPVDEFEISLEEKM